MHKFKFFVKKLISIPFIPIILIVFFIQKIFRISFYYIESTRIGNLAISPELIVRLKKKENIFICFFKNPIANDYIFDLYKKKLIQHKVFCIKDNLIVNFVNKITLYLTGKNLIPYYEIDRSKFNIFNKKTFLKLPKKDIIKGFEILKKIGIKQKWICIHNRDSEFLNFINKKKNWKYHNYRDFSINSMNKLILFFLKKNFSIIRIGKTANEKLSIKDKNIIDLPFNKLRTDFLEVFLIAKANFFIGTSSGAFKIARIFRKPIFLINVCPLESMFVEYWDYPIIFKKLIYSKTKKYLKISEIIKKGVPFTFRNDLLKEKNLKYVSNSDEEIYQFGKEILSYLDNKSYFSGDKRYLKKISLFRAEITKDPRIKKMNFRNNLGKSFLYSLNI